MRILIWLCYLFFIALGIGFSVLNASSLEVNFYVTVVRLPVSVLIILVFGVGMMVGYFLYTIRLWRLKSDCWRLKSQLKKAEQDIKNLRSMSERRHDPSFGER